MNDKHYHLTPKVQQLICTFIRAGGLPDIAAEAAGIPRHVFHRWMRWGNAKRPVEVYRQFRDAVMAAVAEARLCAEAKTFSRAPRIWLRFGPGRTWGGNEFAEARDDEMTEETSGEGDTAKDAAH